MATKFIVRSEYTARPARPKKYDWGPGRTKQSFKKECDINQIMARYKKTGAITHYAKHSGQYMDCSEIDYKTALDQVNNAQAMFDDLPSSIRGKFENDPAQFLSFVQDPDNASEMQDLGLAPSTEKIAAEAQPEPPAPPSEDPEV